LFIDSLKKASIPLQRESLIAQMISNPLFASLVMNILPKHAEAQVDHRTLISFNIGVFLDYTRDGNLNDTTLTFVLPILAKPLPTSRSVEVTVSPLKHVIHSMEHADAVIAWFSGPFWEGLTTSSFIKRGTLGGPERRCFYQGED
jgi:hypothetical protein